MSDEPMKPIATMKPGGYEMRNIYPETSVVQGTVTAQTTGISPSIVVPINYAIHPNGWPVAQPRFSTAQPTAEPVNNQLGVTGVVEGVKFTITPVAAPAAAPMIGVSKRRNICRFSRRCCRTFIPKFILLPLACLCVVSVIAVPITLAILFGSTTPDSEKNFVYFAFTPSSDCGGSKTYQIAYPTESCLTSTANSSISYKFIHNDFNTTKLIYLDTKCNSSVLSTQTFIHNQCNAVSGYPGFSVEAKYKGGTYKIYVDGNSLTATGYGNNRCDGTVNLMTSIAYDACLPTSATTSVFYTYRMGGETCTGSGSQKTCSSTPSTYTKYFYGLSSSCQGPSTFFTKNIISGCVFVKDDIGPYRTYDVPATFEY